jgi:hypothetical protein
MADPVASMMRRVDRFSDEDVLRLHRELARRAAVIYAPMYAERQQTAYRTAMKFTRSQTA